MNNLNNYFSSLIADQLRPKVAEDDFRNLTTDQLRAELAEYNRSQAPAAPALPLPPGITADMSERSRNEAARLYTQAILAKPTGQLSQDERDYLRAHIAASGY